MPALKFPWNLCRHRLQNGVQLCVDRLYVNLGLVGHDDDFDGDEEDACLKKEIVGDTLEEEGGDEKNEGNHHYDQCARIHIGAFELHFKPISLVVCLSGGIFMTQERNGIHVATRSCPGLVVMIASRRFTSDRPVDDPGVR